MASVPFARRTMEIKRLPRIGHEQQITKDRRRVSRACLECRNHKIKCTGERPQCRHCASTNRECIYILPRKDRLKSVKEHCLRMADLMRGLRAAPSAEDNARIAEILKAVEEETSDLRQAGLSSTLDNETFDSPESKHAGTPDQDQGLVADSVDVLDEDILRDERARATGFLGKSSDVQWLREVAISLTQTGRQDEDGGRALGQWRASSLLGDDRVCTFTYWNDAEDVDVDFFVDQHELPPAETAEILFHCYMSKVQDSFPIFSRKLFEEKFRTCFKASEDGRPLRLNTTWQAMLNLVFAIGAKHSHLAECSWRADPRDHLLYQARARASACLNTEAFTQHPDIQQVQALGLLAFYWMSTGQVNRAWSVVGLALRSASSLGLHLRNDDCFAMLVTKENMARTWWSLHSLERTLSVITGRPSFNVESHCSVPLPIPLSEDTYSNEAGATNWLHRQSSASRTVYQIPSSPLQPILDFSRAQSGQFRSEANTGSYFRATVELSIITQNIIAVVYSAGVLTRKSDNGLQDMIRLDQRLEQWTRALPTVFSPQQLNGKLGEPFVRERVMLGIQLSSARMLLTRPCLRRRPWLETNDASSAAQMANACIEAARTVVSFLPDSHELDSVHEGGPWWCIIHHVMQAVAVLLLALSYSSETSHDSFTLAQCAKKAVRWLHSVHDPVAERAHRLSLNLLVEVARQQCLDVSDTMSGDFSRVDVCTLPQPHHTSAAFGSSYMPMQTTTWQTSAAAPPTMARYGAYHEMMTDAAFSSDYVPLGFTDPFYVSQS